MLKKIIHLFLSAVLLLSLSACSSSGKNNEKGSEKEQSAPVQETVKFDLTGSKKVQLVNLEYSVNPDLLEETSENRNGYFVKDKESLPLLMVMTEAYNDAKIKDYFTSHNNELGAALLKNMNIKSDHYDCSFTDLKYCTDLKVECVVSKEDAIKNGLSENDSINVTAHIFACDDNYLYAVLFFAESNDPVIYNPDALVSGMDFSKCIAPEPEEEPVQESTSVTPELKEFLDSYEEFMDEYVAFMEDYKNNSTDLNLLMKYATIITKLSDFEEKADAYDSGDMSAADAAYYLEVMTRIEKKLLNSLN